jgi:hypothetical protein
MAGSCTTFDARDWEPREDSRSAKCSRATVNTWRRWHRKCFSDRPGSAPRLATWTWSEPCARPGAVREFEEREVPDDVLYGILDVARFAPSGGNRQAWRVIVIKDRSRHRGLIEFTACLNA